MVLHRVIFWLGRQWAVTGFGIQAVSRKLEGKFDVEVSRLWDDDLVQQLSFEPWFGMDDFTEALKMARKRFTETPISFEGHRDDEKWGRRSHCVVPNHRLLVQPLGVSSFVNGKSGRKCLSEYCPEQSCGDPSQERRNHRQDHGLITGVGNLVSDIPPKIAQDRSLGKSRLRADLQFEQG